VESVAWITERKNVLSGLFYLLAVRAYLRYSGLGLHPASTGDRRTYLAILGLFLCALLSKTVTATLPAALLILLWWKRERVGRREVVPLVPLALMGLVLGLLTIWLEKHHVGAEGESWSLTAPERLLIAGRALWFYAGKLVFPSHLSFIYHRWIVDPRSWRWILPAVSAAAVLVALWAARRKIGRGPLAAVLFFCVTLFPALGFFNIYPFRFSFVADHFQYLASLGLLSLAAALGTTALERWGRTGLRAAPVLATIVVLVFAGLTWSQAGIYRNEETCWRDTLAKEPGSWMAHTNLAVLLARSGRSEEALGHAQEAIRLKPGYAMGRNNLGIVLERLNRPADAAEQYREAIRLDATSVHAKMNLANLLAGQGRHEEAIALYEEVLRLDPSQLAARVNLGSLLARSGRPEEAVEQFRRVLRRDPRQIKAAVNLGIALRESGKPEEAVVALRRALALAPGIAVTHLQLGLALRQLGREAEAAEEFRAVLRLDPNNAQARGLLGARP